MLDQLNKIATKHGIGTEALQELEQLYDAIAPRIPTQRIGDRVTKQAAPEPLGHEEFKRRYEDLRGIGQGGFSEVREAWDHHVKRHVAVKIQLPTRSSPEDIARFRQEVQITARLQHPGVVPVYDWGELPDERIWFTMKRVRGETIGKLIARLHSLERTDFVQALRRLLDYFRRLCEPVAYAHAQGIVHRDLTPQNLMIGEFGEVHVMDWGLARDLSQAEKAPKSAQQCDLPLLDPSATSVRTRIAGTPYYMPPEQALGEIASMGPASDVYALGAVLYEILAGHPPYSYSDEGRESPERVLERVRNGLPRRIDAVARPEVPRELCALCRHAMERIPVDRPAHAGQLMDALRDWLDGANRAARARRIVEDAHREHRTKIASMAEEAAQRRTMARDILGRLRTFDRAQEKAEGWKLEDEAAAIEQEMLREEIHWVQKVRSALNEAPDLEEAHSALAEYYARNLLRADAVHDEPAAMSYAVLLENHAGKLASQERNRYEALLQGDGRLTLVTLPKHAHVVIKPYELVNRYLMPNDEKSIVATSPIHAMRLPRGSYLLELTTPGCAVATYPVHIGRGKHWDGIRPGDSTPHPIPLLRDDELGKEDIYVPAGWTIAGGDPRAGESLSQRRVWVDGFVIRKYPVTNAEYIEFLNALVSKGQAQEAHRHCPRRSPGANSNDNEPLEYLLDEPTGQYSLRMPATEHALPVVCIDWYSACAYAEYLARMTGLGWRLPSEFEWEKAARGVDGRFMPWGDQLEPTWACVSGCHPDRKHAMPVDSYPTDVSPYGVRGMAGNVRDWCLERWGLDGPRVENDILCIDPAQAHDEIEMAVRGGAWISAGDLMRLGVRYAERPTKRHGVLGFRLVRGLKL